MPSRTITSKGQITLPVKILERLNVGPGDRTDFAEENGVIVVRPSRHGSNILVRTGAIAGRKKVGRAL